MDHFDDYSDDSLQIHSEVFDKDFVLEDIKQFIISNHYKTTKSN